MQKKAVLLFLTIFLMFIFIGLCSSENIKANDNIFYVNNDEIADSFKNSTTETEYDFVEITRWVDQTRERPLLYQESKHPTKIFENKLLYSSGLRNNLVYLIVDETLYNLGLDDEISVFISDLASDGYNVELYTGTYGNPEDLKSFLQSAYPGLNGAIFVGDIPSAWYYNSDDFHGWAEFPMDLFYMDLDGVWMDSDFDGVYDSHSGNVESEIWTGRIDATTLDGSTIGLYENYFSKNHEYRIGNLKLPNRALVYVDDDWSYEGIYQSHWEDNHKLLYNYTTYVGHKNGTNAEDYKNRLTWSYDWITIFAHSSPAGHSLRSDYVDEYWVSSQDIENIDPHGLFYNLFACSSGRFTEIDYLAGNYLFADTHGLGVIGSTKSGAMLHFDKFYQPLADGKNLGVSFKDWFNYIASDGFQNYEISWHYGMILFGDPTLKPNISNNLPIAQINLRDYIEVSSSIEITGSAKRGLKDFSTFENFNISFGFGLNPSEWMTTGITMSGNGIIEIEDDILGEWDTTLSNVRFNTIKLTVNDEDENHTDYRLVLDVNNPVTQVYLTLHRIKKTDQIEGWPWDQADWYYEVSVEADDGEVQSIIHHCPENDDDVIVDKMHAFSINDITSTIKIKLMERDGWPGADDLADVSSYIGSGVDDSTPDTRGAIYYGYYDLINNSLSGDTTIIVYPIVLYSTSGEYLPDGSITTDENDAKIWFYISDNYELPMADIGPNRTVTVEEIVNFDASVSIASEGSTLTKYEWDWDNDGFYDESHMTPIADHAWTESGNYNIILRVTDNYGEISTDSCQITVDPARPIALFTYFPSDPVVNQNITFDASSSYDLDGTIDSYEWDWDNDGSYDEFYSTPIIQHSFITAGDNYVTLRVVDTDGYYDTYSELIYVYSARFTGEFNDYGFDNDGDLFYDNLVVEAEVNVFEAGDYRLSADLYYYNEFLSRWQWFDCYSYNYTYLDVGVQDVSMEFDGCKIYNLGYNGSFKASFVLYNTTSWLWIDEAEYITMSYNYTDFDRPPIEFTGLFDDYGLDTDFDASYNYLVVEAEVEVFEVGNYRLSGDIYYYNESSGWWNYFDYESNYIYLDVGVYNVSLEFDGYNIYNLGYNGSFKASLDLYETTEWIKMDEADYITQHYDYTEFQRPIPDEYEPDDDYLNATLIATDGAQQYHDFHVAGDQDWLKFIANEDVSYIIETSELEIESDTYMYLYALDGVTEIAHNDDGGEGLASRIIWDCSLSGSYYIKIRHYISTACGPDTHYNSSVLEWIPPAEFTDNFNDYGLDNDGNGLFDYFVIETEINVNQAEEFYFSGELNYYNEIDGNWDWFGCYAWNHSYLDIGTHTVLLEFNGHTINNLGHNGTFKADISLANNLDQLDYVEYYTNFYNYTDFQEPDTIPPNITDVHVPDYVGLYHPGNLSANITDNNLQQVSMMLYDTYNITFNQSLVIWYYLDDSGESGTYIVSEYAGTYSNLNQAENSTPASLIMLSNWTQNDKVYMLASFKKNQTASWTQIFLEFNLSNGLLINLAIPSISQLDYITNLIEPGISIVYPFALSLDMGWTVLDSNCNYTLYSIGDSNNPYLSFSPLENGEYAGLIQAQDTEYNMNSTSYNLSVNHSLPPNNPPNTPSNPDPSNGSTEVIITPTLSWTSGDPDPSDTVTYDIYFGTSSPPTLEASDLAVTTYDPGTLDYEETYYWKITADDGEDTTEGSIWSFTTRTNQPPIANDDAYSTVEDTVLNIAVSGVLQNDSDEDGPADITAILEDDVNHGTLLLNTDGSFVYDPDPDWYGVDLFTYRAFDEADYSNTANVTITVNPENDPPRADFSYMPSNPTIEDFIQFTDESYDIDGTIVSWNWDFGDGNISTSQNPNYNYSSEGTYSVTLTVTDDDGETDSETKSVTVTSGATSDVYVDDDAPPSWYDATHVKTIQEGIDNATAGNTVFVCNGTYYENVVVDKTINLTGEDRDDTIIDGGGSGNVVYISAHGIDTSRFTIQNGGHGDSGIQIQSNNNIVSNNTIKDTPYFGFLFSGGASNNEVYDNIIINNYEGICIPADSINNKIFRNIITNNTGNGIMLICSSHDNKIHENTIKNNRYGIYIHASLSNPYNNHIYHNNFIENDYFNAYFHSTDPTEVDLNIWDNNYPSGGNYWDDYAGVDNYHGPDQDIPGSDGIGDTSYDIYQGNKDEDPWFHWNEDHYPLMQPFTEPPGADFTYLPSNPTTSDIIQFTDISVDIDGTIESWLWDFGDGNTSTEQHPTHQYTDSGTYTVILNVTDDDGATNETTQQIFVANIAPVANDDCYSVAENDTLYISAPGVLGNDTDADGDPLNTSLISDVSNGVLTLFDNGSFGYTPTVGYNGTDSFTYKAFDGIDYSNEATVTIWVISNNPPYNPSNPLPSDGKTNVDKNKILSWSGGDPDSGDAVTYDVYFGTSNPPSKINSNQSGTNYDPGTMSYNTKYYWKIIAWDKNGTSAEGPIWSFTTEKQSTQPPYNPPYNPPPTNQNPVADASAGEPYQGFVDEEITFNGSLSYDPDDEGYIVSWYWSYGDGTNGTGETTTHRYYYAGTYTVTLTVADNEDAENTCETTVLISQPNRPPSKPSINGPTTGNKNTEYIYTATSTDPDNDTIKYSFIWGDQTSYVTESEFLPNGSVFTANHIWTVAGKYTITVTTTDNKTISETSKLTVLIDAVNVEDIGYFIDINGDGIYDSFHNDTSNQNSDVGYDDEKYLVDDNGDGEWDFTYSMEEGLKSYEKEEVLTPGFELILVVCALAIVIFWKRKRK